MKSKISIKTVIVLVILVLVGVLSVLGVSAVQTYLSGAAGGAEAKNVLATPSEDGKSATVVWASDKAVQGVVEYGTTPASLLLRSLETDATASHKVNLTPLKPNTSYYFRIRVGDQVFDNSGIPYSFKTKANSEATLVPTTPVVAPTVALVPTIASGVTGTCTRTTDYNGDGVINSIDYISCIKNGGSAPVAVPTIATSSGTGVCKPGVDFDGNGVVNSLDFVKCRQTNK